METSSACVGTERRKLRLTTRKWQFDLEQSRALKIIAKRSLVRRVWESAVDYLFTVQSKVGWLSADFRATDSDARAPYGCPSSKPSLQNGRSSRCYGVTKVRSRCGSEFTFRRTKFREAPTSGREAYGADLSHSVHHTMVDARNELAVLVGKRRAYHDKCHRPRAAGFFVNILHFGGDPD